MILIILERMMCEMGNKMDVCLKCQHSDLSANGVVCSICNRKVDEKGNCLDFESVWYQDEHVAGYYDVEGRFICCQEFGTDSDFDRYAVDVMNGYGYYDDNGRYVSFSKE